ncbi:hypothetical protein GCM10020331_083530 [Ectobacillus funiculus]
MKADQKGRERKKIDVPAVLLDPVAVTKENIMSTVIKDGFKKSLRMYLKKRSERSMAKTIILVKRR